VGNGLLVGLLEDLDFHGCKFPIDSRGEGLLRWLGKSFDHPRATAVGEGLLVGLLDDLDFHDSVLLRAVDECELPSRAVQRMCSMTTSTSQGRSVPFFLSASFLSLFMTALLRVTG
jgi:hypothetical protein